MAESTAVEMDVMTILRPYSGALVFLIIVYFARMAYNKIMGVKPTSTTKSRPRTRANAFVPRASLLDLAGGSILTPWSQPTIPGVIDTKLFGWYSLSTVALLGWVVNRILLNIVEHNGPLQHPKHLEVALEHLPEVFVVMSCMHGFSYAAFFLELACQKLSIDRDSTFALATQHTIQAVLVLGGMWSVAVMPYLAISGKGGICAFTMINYMKMHSYIEVQRKIWCAKKIAESSHSSTTKDSHKREGILQELEAKYHYKSGAIRHLELDDLKEVLMGAISDQAKLKGAAKEYPREPVAGFLDFATYMWMPCLVYEWKFPRNEKIRWWYVVEKSVMVICLFASMWMVMDTFFFPTFAAITQLHPVRAVYQLALPMILMVVLIFFLIFEAILNCLGELTRFADRQFYDLWWNSTTFDEFARTWNKPVHEFLLRHVYIELTVRQGASRSASLAITFLFSMLLHEVIFAALFRMIRPWFLMFGLTQLPLNVLMSNPIFKKTRLGNFIFWYGLFTGIPLISVLYTREYCAVKGNCDTSTM